MKTPQIDRSASLRGRRGIVLFVTGALAMGLGTAGVRALANSPSMPTHPDPVDPVTHVPVAPADVEHHTDRQVTTETPSPTAAPAPDPTALADGVYPTYVRAVDVRGATITVDVLRAFVGAEQRQAAIEDGVAWQDVMYDPVYIRNENPLLRTLPVADDVHIQLIGTCESPNRRIGLTQLREATADYTDIFYYEMTVVGGSVNGIEQKVAVSGC